MTNIHLSKYFNRVCLDLNRNIYISTLIVAEINNKIALFIGLILMGFGMGFTMGKALNYMIVNFVSEAGQMLVVN